MCFFLRSSSICVRGNNHFALSLENIASAMNLGNVLEIVRRHLKDHSQQISIRYLTVVILFLTWLPVARCIQVIIA